MLPVKGKGKGKGKGKAMCRSIIAASAPAAWRGGRALMQILMFGWKPDREFRDQGTLLEAAAGESNLDETQD
jgi:hypothetical protein